MEKLYYSCTHFKETDIHPLFVFYTIKMCIESIKLNCTENITLKLHVCCTNSTNTISINSFFVILNEDAKPMLWAKEIGDELHKKAKLEEFDLSVLRSNKWRLSEGSINSYIRARDQPHPNVVAKVEPWLQSAEVKGSIDRKLKLWDFHYIDKKLMSTFMFRY